MHSQKLPKRRRQSLERGGLTQGYMLPVRLPISHTRSQMPPISFQKALNAILPRDIVIIDAEQVSSDFHARFSAVSRTYRYTILSRPYPSALLRNNAYFFPDPINAQGADTACQSLVGERNFSSFQRSGSERINPICEIYECRCWQDQDLVYFEIEADAFLRGMVRAIVGTILRMHDKEDGVNQLYKILDARDRSGAGASVPPHGLSLLRVKY